MPVIEPNPANNFVQVIMEDSCYMTRTLPSRIRLPPSSTPLSNNNAHAMQHLSGNSTLPAPWTSTAPVNSYQKHTQSSVQQQQYQHLIHHHNPPPGSKGYRGMNGVISTTPPKISNNSNQGGEVYPHHYPPPRPYSQTLPQNKYQYAPVQSTVPSYQHQSYHQPPAVYSQSKIANVHPTHLYNNTGGTGVTRSYASPLRSSPPPSSSIATVKPVSMCSSQSIKNCPNGNRTPSPSFQSMSKLHPESGNNYNAAMTNDVALRRVTANGISNGGLPSSSSSSRRHAMYLQSTSSAPAPSAKTTTTPQPSYPQQQQQQMHQQQMQQQHLNQQQLAIQQQQAINENWNYTKNNEPTSRNVLPAAMGLHHRSLSPQEIVNSYEDSPNRCSPVPQNGNGKNGCLAKPPLPPTLADGGPCPAPNSGGPRPPPRTRPKSWTSSLFNAMRNNHSSVTFQCVLEEQGGAGGSVGSLLPADKQGDQSRPKDASELAMPLTAASASEGQKFYSLPRFQNGVSGSGDPSQAKTVTAKTRSRTPSPFRTIIKGLVKGKSL